MTYDDVIYKLAHWLCIQRNMNWDYINDFRRNQLKSTIVQLLHDIPELKIEVENNDAK
jgi:hypothetical protein